MWSYSGFDSDATTPRWEFIQQPDNAVGSQSLCRLTFDVPNEMGSPVFMYYKLTNFYQNHRRYVRSFNSDQLLGRAASYSSIDGSECAPLDVTGNSIYYPCGLIANSVFNGQSSASLLYSQLMAR